MQTIFVLEYTMPNGYTFIVGTLAYTTKELAEDTAQDMMATGHYKSVEVKECSLLSW